MEGEDTRTITGGITVRLTGGGEVMGGWERGTSREAGAGEVLWQLPGELMERRGSMGATATHPIERDLGTGQWGGWE